MIAFLQADTGSFSHGVSIALIGITIVFIALILIALFIAALPHLLSVLALWLPETAHPHHRELPTDGQAEDEAAVYAAIGFVLHTEYQRQLTQTSMNQPH